ncbi:Extracellular ligand-binding receptor [Neobacillus bataviensis LMG 21833]|uniref:Extracellular ligand-binding receptor n=1 Tax=Neobacillus bataviensis LMG 21833 TaxID=1117379 RepID=K6DTH6_9BACI|nr:ABC transporter substrate-binding protein [Neobacillus bataviensis]EKN71679.1 Extracellular ligand-binding receptor [Neobacillus bataviensis LMG 21833]
MKKRSAKQLFCLSFLIIILFLAGCADKKPGGAQSGTTSKTVNTGKDPIVIGASLPLSGTLGYMGKEVADGIQGIVNQTNDDGGINGRPIKFIPMDDAYDPSKHLANTRYLVDNEKALAIVGSLGTEGLKSAAKFLNPKNYPVVGALSISDAISDPPQKSLFALPAPQSVEGPTLVEYAVKKLKAKRIAFVYQNDSWGEPAFKFSQEKMKSYGMEFVAVETFEPKASEMSTQLHRIKEAKPDVVILYALGSQAASFVNSAADENFKPAMLGPSGLNSPEWIKLVGENGDGIISCSSYFPITADNMQWIRDLHAKYNLANPSNNSLMGTSAALVFVEAAKNAGDDLTPEAILKATEKIKNFDQKIGDPISFGALDDGDNSRRGQTTESIIILKDGLFVPEEN